MNQLAPSSSSAFNYPASNNHNAFPHAQGQQGQQGNFSHPAFAAAQGLGYRQGVGDGGRSSSPSASAAAGGMLQGQQPPPQQHISPSAASPPPPQQQQQQQHPFSPPNAPTPPRQYPMAAPPLPNTPSQQPPNTASTSPPRTPLSPTSESREQHRIAHLLTLNSALLSEIATLQASGHGGVLNPAQAEVARQKGLPDKMASEDYIHTMRRVQANLQYLMHKQQPAGGGDGSGGGGGKQLPGPAIMTSPPHLGDKLRVEYERLRELFPDWMGMEGRAGMGTPGRQNSGQAAAAYMQQAQQQQQSQQS